MRACKVRGDSLPHAEIKPLLETSPSPEGRRSNCLYSHSNYIKIVASHKNRAEKSFPIQISPNVNIVLRSFSKDKLGR